LFFATRDSALEPGLRVTDDFVLKLLADGYTAPQIVEDYPELQEPDVHAAARYGVWLASERSLRVS
jgi:uncharacterized protein (DUF433 family)